MNLHELIKQIDNDSRFIKLIQLGVISLSVIDKKVYYERYLQERTKHKNMQAIENVSIEYNISTDTVRRAIKYMERN